MTIASGSQLWATLSDKPPEALHLSAQSQAFLRQVFFVTPVPAVRRVIFLATPHHGSFIADSPLGQLLARFVTPRAPISEGSQEPGTLKGRDAPHDDGARGAQGGLGDLYMLKGGF